jgi:hypothetical protein
MIGSNTMALGVLLALFTGGCAVGSTSSPGEALRQEQTSEPQDDDSSGAAEPCEVDPNAATIEKAVQMDPGVLFSPHPQPWEPDDDKK